MSSTCPSAKLSGQLSTDHRHGASLGEQAVTQELIFHKSSYSAQGQDCVEIAQIPTSFRKSSYSGETHGNCVEVADLPCGAAIRDSKHPDAGHLPFPATEWTGFLNAALSH
ncbi:DUF397 domain-containing protein [Glycomyces fuscus]|nr:DUF397 domain-containing protein [Glycomyces fuscus]